MKYYPPRSVWPSDYKAPPVPRHVKAREQQAPFEGIEIPEHLTHPQAADYLMQSEVDLLQQRAIERHRVAVRRFVTDCARQRRAPGPAEVLDALQRGRVSPQLVLADVDPS